MKRALAALLLVLGLTAPAAAQISIPNAFVENTRIVSDDVNENFNELGDKSLNRTGGTATGDIIFATKLVPDADGGADIGTALLRFGTVYVTDLDIGDGVVVDTVTVESAAADAINVTGGITAGSGNVGIVDTSGRIPAISTTYFASVSGANITAISEANITDGAILARVGFDETISGSWTFSSSPVISNASPAVTFVESGAGANAGRTVVVQDSNLFQVQLVNDVGTVGSTPFYITRSGSTATNVDLAATTFGFNGTTFNVTTSGNMNVNAAAAIGFTTPSIENTGRYNSATAQPGFFAYLAADDASCTSCHLEAATESYDPTGSYNTSTWEFTAPVAGVYLFCTSVFVTWADFGTVQFQISGVNHVVWRNLVGAAHTDRQGGGCTMASMAASDTAFVLISGSGHTIEGDGVRQSYFTGRLMP